MLISINITQQHHKTHTSFDLLSISQTNVLAFSDIIVLVFRPVFAPVAFYLNVCVL